MVSRRMDSTMERRPLAPVFFLIASFAIEARLSSVKVSFTPSILKSSTNCLTREFLGSVRTLIRAFSSSSLSEAIIGSLPTNSGIIPYLTRSSDSTLLYSSESSSSACSSLTSALKPIPTFAAVRFLMILSRPENAPPQMKRICEVST